jgi:hypothetical protein
MPLALLQARRPSVVLLWALPLYALSGCELFLGDVTDPMPEEIGGSGGSAGGRGGRGGSSGVTTGASGSGDEGGTDNGGSGGYSAADGGAREDGGTVGDGSGGTSAAAGGIKNGGGGGATTAGAPGTGGRVTGGGGTATSGGASGSGGITGSGGVTGSGGKATGGTNATGGALGTGGAACCDCDGDHQLAAGVRCGGTDCDDDDANVFSGQTLYFTVPAKHGGFDYNCANGPERDPALNVTVDCSAVLGLGCDPGTGFFSSTKVAPVCGTSGGWGTCAKPALSCVQNKIDDRAMPCH